jgi:uncharacterized protein
MDIQLLILFIFLTLIAEILGTVGGFGSSVFFVPLAGFFLDFHSVLGITVILHLVSNISKIALFRKAMNRRVLLLVGIPSVIFVIFGAWLSSFVETELLKLLLAIFLIMLSLFLLVKKKFELEPTSFNAITGGGVSGFIAGLVGTGGAIRGLTMAAFNMEKQVFIASSAMIDLMTDLSRSVIYFGQGYMHRHDLYLVPFLFGAAILGTWLGKRIVMRMQQSQFRSVVLIFVFLIGVVSLIGYFKNATYGG